MAAHSASPHVAGLTAIDNEGEKVGTITDVLFDRNGEPRWGVVDPGMLRRAHYVPLDGAYETEDGKVVLPVGRDSVKSAPAAGREHVITTDLEAALNAHYN
jgi:hypothetical protein